MTPQEIRGLALDAMVTAEKFGISRPVLVLVLARDCRGERATIAPGLTGRVRLTRWADEAQVGVETVVEVDAHRALRWARERGAT